jgi:hypothetical protein
LGSDSDVDDNLKDVELAPLTAKESDDSGGSTTGVPAEAASGWGWLVHNTKKNAKVLSACSFYSFCSVSMVLVNKSLASR